MALRRNQGKFEKKVLHIDFEEWNEDKEKYYTVSTKFFGIQNITFDGLTIEDKFDIQEILDITWEKLDKYYLAELTFYTGSGKPCWNIKVVFEGVSIIS